MANIPSDSVRAALQAMGPAAQAAFNADRAQWPIPGLRTVSTPKGTGHVFNQLPPLRYKKVDIMWPDKTVSVSEAHLLLMRSHTDALVKIARHLHSLGFDVDSISTHDIDSVEELSDLIVALISPNTADTDIPEDD